MSAAPSVPMPRAESPESARLLRILVPAVVFFVTFFAFLPALKNTLVDMDDVQTLVENQGWRGLGAENIRWMFTTTAMGHWQPLSWVTFAIDYELAGKTLDAAQFHRTNLLLHALDAVLLYFVALRLMGAAGFGRDVWTRLAAAAGVLLWSIHPLRVESAAWATERRDVLSTCFMLLALLAYLRAFPVGSVRPASVGMYLASIGLLVLSILSKAWGMTFFVTLLILDWYPLRRLSLNPIADWRAGRGMVLAQKLPYLILGVACAQESAYAQSSIGAVRVLADWPISARIAQCFYGLIWYAAKTAWPTNLCPLYELRRGLNPWDAQYVACYILVAGAALVALALWRRLPAVTAAAAVYVVTISPVLGVFQSGDQFVADRYSYLATIPFFVLAAAGLNKISRREERGHREKEREEGGTRQRRSSLWALSSLWFIAVSALFVLTWRQTGVWRTDLTLWAHARASNPDQPLAHLNYGLALDKAGDRQGAIRAIRESLALRPKEGRAWYPLARMLRQEGDFAGAEQAYRAAARDMLRAYMPLVDLGGMLTRLGRPDEAIAAYRAAVEYNEHPRPGCYPDCVPYLALGVALEHKGDLAGARDNFLKARDYPRCRNEADAHLAQLSGR